MCHTHQRKVHTVKGQVATEREQAHPGVAVDVFLADLDEPAAEGQQFHTGTLGGSGQRVQYDVHAVAVGILEDLLGEVDTARVVDVVDTHAPQHLPALPGARRRVDLSPGQPGDGDRGLANTAGGRVDQYLVAWFDPSQVHQPVPGGRRRGRHRRGLVVA